VAGRTGLKPERPPVFFGFFGGIAMARGTVKWFDPQKGFGFISYARGDTEIFVHSSSLVGVQTLHEGDEVEFEIVQRQRGPAARDVSRVQEG